MSQALEKVKGVDSAFVTFSTKTALVTAVGSVCSQKGVKTLLSALKKKRYGGRLLQLYYLDDNGNKKKPASGTKKPATRTKKPIKRT